MLGGKSEQNQSMINRLLDAHNDGSVIDDVAEMLMGTAKGKKYVGLLGTLMVFLAKNNSYFTFFST